MLCREFESWKQILIDPDPPGVPHNSDRSDQYISLIIEQNYIDLGSESRIFKGWIQRWFNTALSDVGSGQFFCYSNDR